MRSALSALPLAALGLVFSLPAVADDFRLDSPDIEVRKAIANKHVFKGFGCEGENISPALTWRGAPAGTKSFAVTVYDPDAPTGSGWWHWVVYNLPATTSSLLAGAGDPTKKQLPAGAVQGRTDFGTPGFGGACPPPGDKPHRYIFNLYALKADKLELPPDATAAMVGYNLNANRIGKASFTGQYGRK